MGAALALAMFFGLGYQAEPGPQGVEVPRLPPEATSSEAEVTLSAPSDGEPNAPAEAATPEPKPDGSPFAGIAEPPPEPPKRTAMITHTVAADEVLWQIADHYHLRPETVLWANDLDDPDLLLVGQQLLIPPQDGVLYTIRPGDRLADVAERYGVDLTRSSRQPAQ